MNGACTQRPHDSQRTVTEEPRRRGWFSLRAVVGAILLVGQIGMTDSMAESPFATTVVEFSPAPGQFVNDPVFNDPTVALGPPVGGGLLTGGNTSVVSLGGFGGSITLSFDHTVLDEPLNPLGMDAIVFGNAYWVGGDPEKHWAEVATIEICLDTNKNGRPDDGWYLIPGSHITAPTEQWAEQTWDDDIGDPTYPPEHTAWIPPGAAGTWSTEAFALPSEPFAADVVLNPRTEGGCGVEGIFGYGDYTPTLLLGDLDADNVVDDPEALPEEFYTVPDDPLSVGISPGSGGGDAFDIAWAIDPWTEAPANLPGFDFIRLTCAVNSVSPVFGEKSPEIDAVADVLRDPFGDVDGDADIDLADFAALAVCFAPQDIVAPGCEGFDQDGDGVVDLADVAEFVSRMTGPAN